MECKKDEKGRKILATAWTRLEANHTGFKRFSSPRNRSQYLEKLVSHVLNSIMFLLLLCVVSQPVAQNPPFSVYLVRLAVFIIPCCVLSLCWVLFFSSYLFVQSLDPHRVLPPPFCLLEFFGLLSNRSEETRELGLMKCDLDRGQLSTLKKRRRWCTHTMWESMLYFRSVTLTKCKQILGRGRMRKEAKFSASFIVSVFLCAEKCAWKDHDDETRKNKRLVSIVFLSLRATKRVTATVKKIS